MPLFKHLAVISLPEGMNTITARVFSESSLQEITIPQSVVSIDDGAF